MQAKALGQEMIMAGKRRVERTTGYTALGRTERSTDHPGSKRWFTHHSDMGPASRFAAAQAWSVQTGRPLPPAMRERGPLREIEPMTWLARLVSYGRPPGRLTPAQRRRRRRKLGTRLARTKSPRQRDALAAELAGL